MDEWKELCSAAWRVEQESRLTKLPHNDPAPERVLCYENVVDWANRGIKEAVSCGNTR